ncbi:MAG: hypothetical protein EBS84_17235 [Proteobacteria bacterium]|nr:hypothetical protein [Pseudomonadota bacterium]
MLPTDTMLTNQKCAAAGRCLLLALFVGLAGCTPPGPRALLTGERLIKEGKFTEAIEPLTEATVLLPRNAQAWNHLGLANHNAGKANAARSAYLKALEVDVNLAPARFNYGCLLLEIGQPAAAANEFAAYTMTQPKAVDGWLKRGRAELLAQQFDAAEKSLRTALTLNAKQPEVWNTLGIVQLFRSRTDTRRASERYADAFQAFNHSVQEQPTYAPALFNAALVSHYYLPRKPVDHRPFALEKYKAFLALNPSVENLDVIKQVVSQLEADIWSELASRGDIVQARRELQREHVNRLTALVLRPGMLSRSDARALLRRRAAALTARIEQASRRNGLSHEAQAHLQDSAESLRSALAAPLQRQGS